MRGGFLHNDAMAERLRATLTKLGARFWTEHAAGAGRRAGAVDIYAELGRRRIAIEIELGPRRIHRDLEKALALDVDLLLIVAPTATVARAIRRRLMTIRLNRTRVRVCLIASAIKHLSDLSLVESRPDKKTETSIERS